MEISELYAGKTATLIGGVRRADYETHLRKLGFVEVFRACNTDKKTIKKMKGFIPKSDLAILVMACCSHEQRKKAEKICNDNETPYVRVANSRGPQAVMQYLIDNYSRIQPKL